MTTQLDPTSEPTWTPDELVAVRAGLEDAVARLRSELVTLGSDLSTAAAGSTIEILHDELDVAAHRSDLLQDAVQAENVRAILAQTEHVIARLDAGLYGTCEACSGHVGRARLEAFPRATLCMSCVA